MSSHSANDSHSDTGASRPSTHPTRKSTPIPHGVAHHSLDQQRQQTFSPMRFRANLPPLDRATADAASRNADRMVRIMMHKVRALSPALLCQVAICFVVDSGRLLIEVQEKLDTALSILRSEYSDGPVSFVHTLLQTQHTLHHPHARTAVFPRLQTAIDAHADFLRLNKLGHFNHHNFQLARRHLGLPFAETVADTQGKSAPYESFHVLIGLVTGEEDPLGAGKPSFFPGDLTIPIDMLLGAIDPARLNEDSYAFNPANAPPSLQIFSDTTASLPFCSIATPTLRTRANEPEADEPDRYIMLGEFEDPVQLLSDTEKSDEELRVTWIAVSNSELEDDAVRGGRPVRFDSWRCFEGVARVEGARWYDFDTPERELDYGAGVEEPPAPEPTHRDPTPTGHPTGHPTARTNLRTVSNVAPMTTPSAARQSHQTN